MFNSILFNASALCRIHMIVCTIVQGRRLSKKSTNEPTSLSIGSFIHYISHIWHSYYVVLSSYIHSLSHSVIHLFIHWFINKCLIEYCSRPVHCTVQNTQNHFHHDCARSLNIVCLKSVQILSRFVRSFVHTTSLLSGVVGLLGPRARCGADDGLDSLDEGGREDYAAAEDILIAREEPSMLLTRREEKRVHACVRTNEWVSESVVLCRQRTLGEHKRLLLCFVLHLRRQALKRLRGTCDDSD